MSVVDDLTADVSGLARNYPDLLERLLCIDPNETDAIADEITEAQLGHAGGRETPEIDRLLAFHAAVQRVRCGLINHRQIASGGG